MSRSWVVVLGGTLFAAAGAVGAGNAAAQTGNTGQDVDRAPGAVLRPPREVNAPPEGYKLQPTREGGYDYDGPKFAARIAPDGSVTFHARHFQISPDGPSPSTVGLDTVTPQDPISGRFPAPAIESRPGVRFDVTDEYMRLLGKDPARDAKISFLDATFDLRMNMAAEMRRVRQQRALDELPGRLTGLWRDPRLTLTERQHLLRAMWDDLAEGPEGAPARDIIRAFAQQHLSPQEAAAFH